MGLLRFGVGPIAAGDERREHRAQAESALSRAVASDVRVIPTASYAELFQKLERGDVDLAWLPPVLVVRGIDRGMTLLLGCVRGAKLYHGAIFVSPSSPRTKPADLRGARVGWVDPDSCSGYLFPRVTLSEEHGLDPATLFSEEHMLGSHDAVVRAVERGEVDCGATWARTTSTMRAVVTSAPIPSDAVCAAQSMDRARRDHVSAALAELHRSPEGATTLHRLFDVARLEPALPRHYDLVRRAMVGTGAAISSTRFR
jgi:phosphonate transport system substrate-binding protein